MDAGNDASMQLNPENILFGVMTSGRHSRTRAQAVKASWCGTEKTKCVFFSETAETAKDVQPVVVVDVGADYKSAQLKFLPALQFLRTHPDFKSGKVKWVMLVDDDSYVFVRNLMLALGQLGVGTPRYIGDVLSASVVDQLNGGPSHDFVMGGAGSLLSREALERMDLQTCIDRQNTTQWKLWQSDWMIGACAAEVGILPEMDPRFHQWYSCDGSTSARDHRFAWPVTLHPVHPTHMVDLSALRTDIRSYPRVPPQIAAILPYG